MKNIKRFTLMRKIGTFGDFATVITDRNKYAKVPEGYERCGKSFLGVYKPDIGKDGRQVYIYQ